MRAATVACKVALTRFAGKARVRLGFACALQPQAEAVASPSGAGSRQSHLLQPPSGRQLRVQPPNNAPRRSRPSAFAGSHQGHSSCQFHTRHAASPARARWAKSKFVFSSPGAFGTAACKGRSQWLRQAGLPSLTGSSTTGSALPAMPPNMSVNRERQRHGTWAARRFRSSSASRPRRHAVVARLPLR